MIKFGWIKRFKDKVLQLKEVLNYFGVVSQAAFNELWKEALFRRSKSFTSDQMALAAWLRRGEIEAGDIACSEYDSEKFKNVLEEVRKLTNESANYLREKIVSICSSAGVAVVFVPELPKTRVSGATRWLNPNRALIQLSLRYKTDDHLWFTFYHEAGHILLHGKKSIFIETDKKASDQEHELEADKYAASLLIPLNTLQSFLSTTRLTKAAIKRFANELNISPGIVVGRLQHDGIIPMNHCNDLKRRFDWARSKV